ncbi:hypothetical protein QJS10_CPA03g01087 [Acorus calamus]|uniref:Glycine-rich protein n=1 Tax=Acorus calamus TaxID=4465 RepID=A0AAV9F355_ACOCL|nr:hypothetical protein QJS10_CPA03g01087 [Acorus calamus]
MVVEVCVEDSCSLSGDWCDRNGVSSLDPTLGERVGDKGRKSKGRQMRAVGEEEESLLEKAMSGSDGGYGRGGGGYGGNPRGC